MGTLKVDNIQTESGSAVITNGVIPAAQLRSSGVGKILLGAALIGLVFMTGGATITKAAGLEFHATALGGAFLNKSIAYVGGYLLLSGVSEMLFPVPKPPSFESEEDPRLSFSFSGTQQTGRAGTPVPLVYGEIFTGSVVISGGIDTEQVQA